MTAVEIVVGYQVCGNCGGNGCGRCGNEGECSVTDWVERDDNDDDTQLDAA